MVKPKDQEAVFLVTLKKGDTTLKTFFLDDKEMEVCGAYYLYVNRKT